MISHRHQCVFIHIPKTAGVSVESVFLSDLKIARPDRAALQLGPNRRQSSRPFNLSHLQASQYVDWHFLSAELFANYFKFAVVRDPIARAISTYKYLGYPLFCSFDRYVERHLPSLLETPSIAYFVCPQRDYTHDDQGNQLVDQVGRFENIASDFSQIAAQLGLPPELPHENKTTATPLRDKVKRCGRIFIRHGLVFPNPFSQHKPSAQLVSEATRKALHRIYEQDFDTFGY